MAKPVYITFRVTRQLRQKLQAEATVRELSLSEWVRYLVTYNGKRKNGVIVDGELRG